MDNQRLILFVAFSLVLLLIYSAWQEDSREHQERLAESEAVSGMSPAVPGIKGTGVKNDTASIAAAGATSAPKSAADVPDVPKSAPTFSSTPSSVPGSADLTAVNAVNTTSSQLGQQLFVQTDSLNVEINSIGGEITRVSLPTYPVALNKPDEPFQLLNNRLPNVFVAQSGLLASQGTAPDHHAIFTADKTSYQLADGEKELKVRLHWIGEDGLKVIKTYIFHRGNFVIDLDVEVQNTTQQVWTGRVYRQFQRTEMARESYFIYTYTGGVVSSTWDPYEKVEFSEMADWKPEQSYNKGGWVAMLQHYFLGAWIPAADEANHFYTKALADGRYMLGLSSEERSVAPGSSVHFKTKLYTGPKDQLSLEEIEPNLRLTVDYGVLDILSKPLFWLMSKINGMIGNWGLAIISITILLKLLFFPLSAASYKSMANMRRLAPKLKMLKERYGDDRQKMSQATMKIYKEEKINPLGGCLPILVQIPVFIALYWVLLESVEMRQAPFYLWIDDLSQKDPFYVLPLLMGISMFVQQKLNPPPMDPIQMKVMQALPFIFTVFFAFFPAGLVLYWVVNNLLSIAQQYFITKKIVG
jgi:YidC/Oxa1 family membrane protein insertase